MNIINSKLAFWHLAWILFREFLRIPSGYLIFAGFGFLIWFTPDFAHFAFGDENRLVVETTMSSILVGSLVASIFFTSTSIQDELENRTLLTLLAKPLSRRDFILGKFTGGLLIAVFGTLLLTLVFLAMVWIRDPRSLYARESVPLTREVFLGIFLLLQQTTLVLGLSILLASYVKSALNVCFSMAFLFLCNLNGYMGSYLEGFPAFLKTFVLVLFYFIPDFSIYNISELISEGKSVPGFPFYVVQSSIYTILFVLFELLISILIFERKEISQ